LKTASWLLTLLLAGFLVYAFAQVVLDPSPISLHVYSRYAQFGEAETGIHSLFGAVLADYRSVDFLAVAMLFSSAALALLLFFSDGSKNTALWPTLLCLILGNVLVLGLGFTAILKGSPFLDYEALAAWVASPRARLDGAWMLAGGVLLNLAGLVMLWVRWSRTAEGSSVR